MSSQCFVCNEPQGLEVVQDPNHATSMVKACPACRYDLNSGRSPDKIRSDLARFDPDDDYLSPLPTFSSYQLPGPSRPSAKCFSGHFERMGWVNKSYGFLRLSSFRASGELDYDCAAGLFFYDSWRGVVDVPPSVEVLEGESGFTIPDLGAPAEARPRPPIALLNWPDCTAPPPAVLNYVAWTAKQIKAGLGIQIGCLGGHGRTGTFAALVFKHVAPKVYPKGGAIEFVRKEYCKDAIEGKAQEDAVKNYLEG